MTDLILPKFYHFTRWESDRDWIIRRMSAIPANKQAEVSAEYERLYQAGRTTRTGRKKANEYLHGVAVEYRDEMRASQ